MNGGQRSPIRTVNETESMKIYPRDNPVAQTVQNGEIASVQGSENVSETSSSKQRL